MFKKIANKAKSAVCSVKAAVMSRKAEGYVDYYGDKDLNTGINVAFSLMAHNCNLCGRHCGLNLISEFLKHKHYLKLSFN